MTFGVKYLYDKYSLSLKKFGPPNLKKDQQKWVNIGYRYKGYLCKKNSSTDIAVKVAL